MYIGNPIDIRNDIGNLEDEKDLVKMVKMELICPHCGRLFKEQSGNEVLRVPDKDADIVKCKFCMKWSLHPKTIPVCSEKTLSGRKMQITW